MLSNYTNWVIKNHKLVLLFVLLAVVFLASGARNLSFTNEFRVYFSKENPQLEALERMEVTYGKQDAIYFFITPKSGDLFKKEHLSLIHDITEAGWLLPHAERVNSITNFQHTEVKGDELTTGYILRHKTDLTPQKIAWIKQAIMDEPTLINNAIAKDGSATGVVVRLRLPPNNKMAPDEAVGEARKLQAKMRETYPDANISLGGGTTAGVVLGEAVGADMQNLVGLSYAILIVGLLVLLRSLRGMLVTVLLVTFSIAATMGTYGWFGVILTPVAGWVPSVVMTIAVADCVHILISYYHSLQQGVDRKDAVREAIRINVNPVFVTSLTTIIGVLCLNFSDSPPYRDLGNMVALGVLFAWIFSMTMLPAVLAWLDIGKRQRKDFKFSLIDSLASFVITRRKALLIVMGLCAVILASFIPRNELTERWHEYFDESFEQRRTIEQIDQRLTGVHSIRYLLDTGEDNGIHKPEYLQTVEAFANWYRQQPGVAYVGSIVDVQKRLNKNMHSGDKEWYRLPESRELAAQYFLLYEIGLPRELNMDDMVNYNRSGSLFRVLIHKTHSEAILNLDNRAREWLQQNAGNIQFSEGTGMDIIFGYINHRNIRQLLLGTLLALVLISIVLIFALRSVRLGLLSLVPNLVPATLAYGTWGLTVGKVDLSASVVICMSLGIVVDDTVHFLSKYLRARREQNLQIEEGIRYAFQTVGVALSITTIVLVAGFLVLVASSFSPTWVSGLLLAMTLSYALLADFLFLPPLLMVLDRRGYTRQAV
ncbi:MAG: MMPL family transporter [Gammaproteobacteria bacterium]|nr:MMPL family transporter [Gammaproteobacteria bacterium]